MAGYTPCAARADRQLSFKPGPALERNEGMSAHPNLGRPAQFFLSNGAVPCAQTAVATMTAWRRSSSMVTADNSTTAAVKAEPSGRA